MTNTPAPGWYPDNQGNQRYWDGSAWTDHTAPAGQPMPPPPSEQPSSATPNDGSSDGRNWFLRHKILSAVLAVFVIGMIGSAFSEDERPNGSADGDPKLVAGSTDGGSSEQPTSTEESAKAKPKPKPKPKPASLQDRFVGVVEDASDKAKDADNELQVVKARKDRAKAMCGLLPNTLKVSNWRGTVDDVATTLGGDSGVLDIKLTDDINVATWNNGLSDIGSDTLVEPDSELFEQMIELSDGDKVVFSGEFVKDDSECLQEQSVTDLNGVATPTFSFRFESIKKD